MPHDLITIARPFISPYKYIPHKLNAVQFVKTEQPINIKVFRYTQEGQRAQVVVNKRDIRCQSRYPFVDVFKRLEIRQVYCNKKCLFEWIGYGSGGIQDLTEDFID